MLQAATEQDLAAARHDGTPKMVLHKIQKCIVQCCLCVCHMPCNYIWFILYISTYLQNLPLQEVTEFAFTGSCRICLYRKLQNLQGKNARSSSHVMADTARCVMLAAGQSLMLKRLVICEFMVT